MEEFFNTFAGGNQISVAEAYAVYNPSLISSFISFRYFPKDRIVLPNQANPRSSVRNRCRHFLLSDIPLQLTRWFLIHETRDGTNFLANQERSSVNFWILNSLTDQHLAKLHQWVYEKFKERIEDCPWNKGLEVDSWKYFFISIPGTYTHRNSRNFFPDWKENLFHGIRCIVSISV